MISKIGALGDRLLSKLVPRHTAQATCYCWTDGIGTCVSRRCCYYGTRCNLTVCGSWQYRC